MHFQSIVDLPIKRREKEIKNWLSFDTIGWNGADEADSQTSSSDIWERNGGDSFQLTLAIEDKETVLFKNRQFVGCGGWSQRVVF